MFFEYKPSSRYNHTGQITASYHQLRQIFFARNQILQEISFRYFSKYLVDFPIMTLSSPAGFRFVIYHEVEFSPH